MFQTPKWDHDASSESLSLQLFGPHSTNGKKTHRKRKKDVKTNKSIKETQLFPTKVKQNIHTPTPTDASKARKVKPKLMSLPASDNRMQNVERKKMKSKNRNNKSLSYMKRKSKSLSDKIMCNFEVPHFGSQKKIKHPLLSDTVSEECENNETNMCNSKFSESHLGLQKKRKHSLSSDTGSVPHRKKSKKNSTQEDPLLPESSISKEASDFESNKESANGNRTKQNRKKHKKIVNKRVENLSESFEKHMDVHDKSTGKSPYNINRLKQMFATSNTEEDLSKENISKKKQEETGTLRERMLKRLQASRFRYINEQLYTSGGKDAKQYFEAKPEVFQVYHEGYQQQVKQWPINPLDIIITALKKKSPRLVVADFGCGDARLAQSVPNKVHSFDLVAMSKEVTACDMTHTPLSIASVDVVVFCLSLMGTNLGAYLTEANRVLKEGGLLKIAEVESRFEDVETFIKTLQKFGFVSIWKDLSHNLFYFMDFKKERCISKKMKKKLPELTLKPCLYKKR